MMRTCTRVGLPTLLAAALAASPTFSHDGEPEKMDAILLQIKSVNKSLQDLKGLPENVAGLDKKLADVEKKLSEQLASQDINANVRMQALQRELNALKDQHVQMKQELEALRNRAPARQPITSLYPAPAGTTTGRLRLVNTFPEPVSIIVNNGPGYRLAPFQDVMVDVPAGPFTYEVLSIQGRTSRQVTAGETFTIHVHPR